MAVFNDLLALDGADEEGDEVARHFVVSEDVAEEM